MCDNQRLLKDFVKAFNILDDCMLLMGDTAPPEMQAPWDYNLPFRRWQPVAVPTDRSELQAIYRELPGPLPPLYEDLLLSWRWFDVALAELARLLGNPPGQSFGGLIQGIKEDPSFNTVLIPAGFVRFGMKSGDSYDPACFDLNRRRADGDCPIVSFDHETILCNLELGTPVPMFPSFRRMVESVIARI